MKTEINIKLNDESRFFPERSEHKKLHERSEFRVSFAFKEFTLRLTKKLPLELSESEVQ